MTLNFSKLKLLQHIVQYCWQSNDPTDNIDLKLIKENNTIIKLESFSNQRFCLKSFYEENEKYNIMEVLFYMSISEIQYQNLWKNTNVTKLGM